MSYFRSMGDGPVTDPSQVDDTVIVGTVTPTRVGCSSLPPDSPWREAGQVCADAPLPTPTPPATPSGSLLDTLKNLIGGAATGAAAPAATAATDTTSLLWLAGLGAAGYYAYRYFNKRGR